MKPTQPKEPEAPKLSLVERRERKIAELNAKNERAKQLVRVREQIDTIKAMVSAKDYRSARAASLGLATLLAELSGEHPAACVV